MSTVLRLRRFCLRHIHVIGIIICSFYVFLFLILNQLYNKPVHVSTSTIQTTSSASEKVTYKIPDTSTTLHFNKHVTSPWHDDPDCRHFTVQVCFLYLLLTCNSIALKYFQKYATLFISFIFKQLADRNSLPKWALTSFPGSGVTWTRQMIEGITGIYTGSMHEQDPSPVRTSKGIYSNSFSQVQSMYLLNLLLEISSTLSYSTYRKRNSRYHR